MIYYKDCKKCGTRLPADEYFTVWDLDGDGYYTRCRICVAEENIERSQKRSKRKIKPARPTEIFSIRTLEQRTWRLGDLRYARRRYDEDGDPADEYTDLVDDLGDVMPGTYAFHDRDGNIIRVGQTKNLKSRLSRYFSQGNDSKFSEYLRRNLPECMSWCLHFIWLGKESDRVLLEERWIRIYNPFFNKVYRTSVTPFLPVPAPSIFDHEAFDVELLKGHLKPDEIVSTLGGSVIPYLSQESRDKLRE